jgi:trehalose 6-phosphate synthase
MLRERGHRNRMGFFLHVPFPPPEILTALPNHEHLIPSMADYNVLGFQTENDTDNFVRYLRTERCIPVLDHTFQVFGRHVRVDTFPIGIETAEFNRLAQSATRSPFVTGRINATYGEAFWTPIRYVNRTYSRVDLAGPRCVTA